MSASGNRRQAPLGVAGVAPKGGGLYHSGGQALYDEVCGGLGIKAFIAGNSGPQAMGWFRKELTKLDDFKGLRIRTAGFAGETLRRVGAAVVSLPGGEIFQALQAGTIDAADFVGHWNDAAFGFHQVTKKVAESYARFRNQSSDYARDSHAGQMNARLLPIKWG